MILSNDSIKQFILRKAYTSFRAYPSHEFVADGQRPFERMNRDTPQELASIMDLYEEEMKGDWTFHFGKNASGLANPATVKATFGVQEAQVMGEAFSGNSSSLQGLKAEVKAELLKEIKAEALAEAKEQELQEYKDKCEANELGSEKLASAAFNLIQMFMGNIEPNAEVTQAMQGSRFQNNGEQAPAPNMDESQSVEAKKQILANALNILVQEFGAEEIIALANSPENMKKFKIGIAMQKGF